MITLELSHAIRRARILRTSAWAIATAAVAFAAWRIAERLGVVPLAAGVFAAGCCAFAAIWLFRHRPIDAATLIEHYNRTLPTLEESAALLQVSSPALTPLERLQQERVTAAWNAVPEPPALPLPSVRRALMVALSALVLGVLVPMIPDRSRAGVPLSGPATAGSAPFRLGQVALRWTPPSYTGHPSRDATTLDNIVEAGSAVTWRVTSPEASAVIIVSAAGDTIRGIREPGGGWRADEVAERGRVWHVEATSGNQRIRGEEHLLTVVPDREPVVAVLAPAGRIELEWREPHEVVVRAVARDDYGLSRIRLAATVAKGRGEGVKFKQNWLSVDVERRTGARELVASRLVHLDSLGVEPGDEVFLAFEATDNRNPSPQSARSETIFLSLIDTLAGNSATLSGVAIRVEPAYFRSQRQIILDTEALLRDVRAGRVHDGGFARSLEIGIDQHLLRLRYGAMVGEETNETEGPGQDISGRHEHDMAENATLLSPTVKALLKSALAEMWDAERELRTGRPAGALPAEYRALASLEEVRRAERAYVKRIGFEPKPVDINRTRLTKKADRLAALSIRDSTLASTTEPLLRDAIIALDAPTSEPSKQAFDAAARRLAERALDAEPARHLETLRALRRLIDGPCAECREVALRGLLEALPAPPPPIRSARPSHGALGSTAP